MDRYDVVVIGGGIYGSLGAALTAAAGRRVLLLEQADRLLGGASAINQARVHNGYHYPRSLPTAARSHANYERFRDDFADAIVEHDSLYAIAGSDSRVTAAQFERVCEVVGIPLTAVHEPDEIVDPGAVAGLWHADEIVFDADELRSLVERRLAAEGVEVRLDTAVTGLDPRTDEAGVVTRGGELRGRLVLDCTYGGLERSGVRVPDDPRASLVYELAEIALVETPAQLRDAGLTVMDGPFFSCIPAPSAGCHSLTHVRYTPHVAARAAEFPWEALERPPRSRFELMRRAAAPFAPWAADLVHVDSLFAVKAIPPERERDDARPILVRRSSPASPLVSVLGGKLDNVYDFLSWLRRELI
jgi:glycine/D-amino acid oxidase-like deaminating enzyme